MIVYYVYKGKALHTKVWSVTTFIEGLQGYYKDVRRLKAIGDEYMRLKADNDTYIVYERFKGSRL